MYIHVYMYVCIYIVMYTIYIQWVLFSHKSEWNDAVCSNTEGPGDVTLNEVSQAEEDEHCIASPTYEI